MGMLYEYSQEDQDRMNAKNEQFNDIGDLNIDGVRIAYLATNFKDEPVRIQLMDEQLDISEARALRDWLNKVIP